jgi:hypothetical protein
MEQFDLIGQLHRQAKANGWAFAAGDNFYKNIALASQDLETGQLVLTCEFNAFPTIRNSVVTEIRYDGALMLGRKQDNDGVEASLDEEFLDKYDRRLLELMQYLISFIGTFTCENELEITAMELIQQINTFDSNIDFVGGNITLIQ